MNREYSLILITTALFFFASLFLFWQNDRQLDPDLEKDWWVIAFDRPGEPESLSFTIENHSESLQFRYEITADKTVFSHGTVSVPRGETRTIEPPLSAQAGTRTVITVSSTQDRDTKEIYR